MAEDQTKREDEVATVDGGLCRLELPGKELEEPEDLDVIEPAPAQAARARSASSP